MNDYPHINSLSEFIDKISIFNTEYKEIITSHANFNLSKYEDDKNCYIDVQKYLAFVSKYRTYIRRTDIYSRKDGRIYYRGESNKDYDLIPSVFRDNHYPREDYYYREMMVRCPETFGNLSRLDRLVTMQHYNCPTRLLDITANPLVALYFACKTNNVNDTNTGVVYLFYTDRNGVLYSDSDRVIMLSSIPELSYEDKVLLNRVAMDSLDKGKLQQYTNKLYKDRTVEKYYQSIRRERNSFTREINPIDLLRPIIVLPNRANSRIIRQDGAFILSGLSANNRVATAKLELMITQKIYVDNQSRILEELDSIGINEASLFPDVEHVATYLKTVI